MQYQQWVPYGAQQLNPQQGTLHQHQMHYQQHKQHQDLQQYHLLQHQQHQPQYFQQNDQYQQQHHQKHHQQLRNTLKVTGEATVSAAPDKAVINLGVTTENVSLNVAQRENAAAVTSVINALLGLGIPNEHIQTSNYSIDIQYDFVDGKQIFRGYRVSHLLQVTVTNIERTGLVVDTSVENGANTVTSIQFSLTNPDEAYNLSLTKAIQNSLMKARTIARTLGVTLQPVPFQVKEVSRADEPRPFAAVAGISTFSQPTPIQPGELQIYAAVEAKFTYY